MHFQALTNPQQVWCRERHLHLVYVDGQAQPSCARQAALSDAWWYWTCTCKQQANCLTVQTRFDHNSSRAAGHVQKD